jgi:hypothetical protein
MLKGMDRVLVPHWRRVEAAGLRRGVVLPTDWRHWIVGDRLVRMATFNSKLPRAIRDLVALHGSEDEIADSDDEEHGDGSHPEAHQELLPLLPRGGLKSLCSPLAKHLRAPRSPRRLDMRR